MSEHDAIEQLAALLDGEPVRDAPSSLAALADLATAVQEHAELMAPTAEFRTALRAELVAAADAPPGLVERVREAWTTRTAHLRASARVAVATVTASSMIGSAGVAVAAQEALPGELLHGLKGLTEDARLLLAVDGVAEARLHLEFARERLGELQATAGRLDTDQVVALLAEMDAHSEAGAEVLLDGVPSGAADAQEIRSFTAGQRAGLVSVFNDLPVLAKPVAEDSLELLRRIEVFVAGDASSTSRSAPDAPGRPSDDAASTSPDAPSSESPQRTSTQHSGLDVVLGDHADVVSPEDCDCIELPGTTEDESAPSGDDASAREDTTASDTDEEPEPAPEDEPFEPTDGLVVPDPGEQERDEDKHLDVPLSGEDLSRSEVDDTVVGGDLATGVDTLVEADSQTLEQTEGTVDALLDE